jgi:site-specific recombinase XerD
LRNRAILLTLISSGARISEVMSLRVTQFASNEDSAWICGKRKLWRYIFFAPGARVSIQEYITERNRLFPREKESLWLSSTCGSHLKPNAVSAMLATTLRLMGLPRGTVTPHSFRHYVATEMLHLGFSIHQIQKYLGHTTATTTSKVYAHVLDEDRRRAVDHYHQTSMQFNKKRPAPPAPPFYPYLHKKQPRA